jgi:hypothetical protein
LQEAQQLQVFRTYAGTLNIVVEELKLPKKEDKQLW